LCEKGIIHCNKNNKICWERSGSEEAYIRLSYNQLWKDEIIKQAQAQEAITTACINVNMISAVDAAIAEFKAVQVQNIVICQPGENDLNNTDKKYIDSDTTNNLDILAALAEMCSKKTLIILKKKKQVIQDHVKKQRQYTASRIICCGKYVDAL